MTDKEAFSLYRLRQAEDAAGFVKIAAEFF